MLESTYNNLVLLAHIALVTMLIAGFIPRFEAKVVFSIAGLFGMVLFAWAAVASTNVVTITNSGVRTYTQQPAMGWWAFGMAFLCLIGAVIGTLSWLPDWREVTGNGSPF